MKRYIPLFALLLLSTFSEAQFLKKLGKTAENSAKRTVERRVDKETSANTDKAIDKATKAKPASENKTTTVTKATTSQEDSNTATSSNTTPPNNSNITFSAQSKFDFVAGEKTIVYEDFSQVAVGDFPARWNTDASGEVKTIAGREGKWLALTGRGAFTPEFMNSIPENATIEFDLMVSPEYDYYDSPFFVAIAQTKDKNGFAAWQMYDKVGVFKQTGAMFNLHPQDVGDKTHGRTLIRTYENGKDILENQLGKLSAFNMNNPSVHIAIWRQNQRLRIYAGETKIWDLPRAFTKEAKYNTLVFSREKAKEGNEYFISNIRLAIGTPDTRHKLLDEGKFSTSGIYFATGSAQIKPESHGVIKEIAEVLKENGDVKILITGHTDNSGSSAANQKLSEQRAESVKKYLNAVFDIDNSRMTTSGKGQSAPVADNNSAEGKAQNRRVEFIKK